MIRPYWVKVFIKLIKTLAQLGLSKHNRGKSYVIMIKEVLKFMSTF